MKIGVFGDSFAALQRNTTLSWVDILAEKYSVTNHAIVGSNLYYSVEEFKKHHSNYDKIIFIVTQPGRLRASKVLPLDIDQQFIQRFIFNFSHGLEASKYQKLAWEAANQYYLYLQDINHDRYIHNLMLKDIKEIRPDIILIPGFLDSWYGADHAMFRIVLKENTAWDLGQSTIIENYKDLRNCHMIAENNFIFAEKAKQWLSGQPVYINLDEFVTTTDKDFYLKPL
jgi:hypothetical protein